MPDKKLSIKEWSEDDRPREKLVSKGAVSLSDSELLAILISTGSGDESALDLAKKLLLVQENNLHNLSLINFEKIITIKGLGKAKGATILAAIELGRRIKVADINKRDRIRSFKDVLSFLDPLRYLSQEEFWLICMNSKGEVLDISCVHRGGIQNVIVDMRLIFSKAVEKKAVSIIVAHNHPSGESKPSTQDNLVTKRIKEAATLMEIKLHDHVIVSSSDQYSYAEDGAL